MREIRNIVSLTQKSLGKMRIPERSVLEVIYPSIEDVHIFYRQLDFSSELGVANEIFENESKSFLRVA